MRPRYISYQLLKPISDAHPIQIDQAMFKLPSISRTVRELRNSLAPINRLPPEILALVPTFRASERDLMNATAVCKHWRRTFISTPDLWNNIICSEHTGLHITPRLQTYFERSGSVPVDVEVPAKVSRLLSPHTDRISGLTLNISSQWDLGQIAAHLSKPAPLLETVELCTSYKGPRGLVLPTRFFEAFLSSAKTLNVRGAVLCPGPCKLSKLTTFTLRTSTTSYTSAVLLDALEQMPLLEVLEVTYCRGSQQDPVPKDRVVTLPRMEEVAILIDQNRLESIENRIFPALRLPSARRVILHSTSIDGPPRTPILPLSFQERLPRFAIIPEVFATFDTSDTNIRFLGSDGSTMRIRAWSPGHPHFTESVLGGTPFNSVCKLSVSFRSPEVDLNLFFGLLWGMNGLESLRMIQNTVQPLGWWIGDSLGGTLCPALTSLIVIDTDFDRAKLCLEELKRIREGDDGVPIAEMEVRYCQNEVEDDDPYAF